MKNENPFHNINPMPMFLHTIKANDESDSVLEVTLIINNCCVCLTYEHNLRGKQIFTGNWIKINQNLLNCNL